MFTFIRKIYFNQFFRYILGGGLTTLVNLLFYFILTRVFDVVQSLANMISIIVAIAFSYGINTIFVFKTDISDMKMKVLCFVKFLEARLLSMIIEQGGFILFVNWWLFNDLFAKCMIQFIVIVLNYILSKFYVFHSRREYES